jgi:hypothetical protein
VTTPSDLTATIGTMSAAAGPFYAAAGLLGAAGALKVARPAATARALQAAGLRDGRRLAPVLGAVEVAVAVAALALGGRATAAAVAVAYLGFAAFAALLLRRKGAAADCGCFGQAEAPVTDVHVGMNLAIAAIAAWAVASPPGAIGPTLADQPLWGLPFLALTVLCGWLLFVALTLLGPLRAGWRRQHDDRAGRTP